MRVQGAGRQRGDVGLRDPLLRLYLHLSVLYVRGRHRRRKSVCVVGKDHWNGSFGGSGGISVPRRGEEVLDITPWPDVSRENLKQQITQLT